MNIHEVIRLTANWTARPSEDRQRMIRSALVFLSGFLEEYVRRNPTAPLSPLDAILGPLTNGDAPSPESLRLFAAAFRNIMFDADETDRWYDITTQDTLLILRDLAKRQDGFDTDDARVLDQLLDPIYKVVAEVERLKIEDADFATMNGALQFLDGSAAEAIYAKAKKLMVPIQLAWT